MIEKIPEELSKKMNETANMINELFKPQGFALLVFDMDTHEGRMNYISNANKEEMIIALKEFIAVHEGRRLNAYRD